MRFVPNSITRAVGRKSLSMQKHSPTILFGAGVVGMVGTVVLASRATLKLEEVLDEIRKDQDDLEFVMSKDLPNFTEQDGQRAAVGILIKGSLKIARLYGPALLVGSLSIGALCGSHRILDQRNAALSAAYTAIASAFASYRGRVVEEYGPQKDKELFYGVSEREVLVETDTGPQPMVKKHPSLAQGETMYARWFDENNKHWFPTKDQNLFFLHRAESMLNDRLRSRGFLYLNDAYEALGLSHTKAGSIVGWVYDSTEDYINLGIYDAVENQIDDFMTGASNSIMLDFNVDGPILDRIEEVQKPR